MSINISCVQCHKQYSVGEQFVGRAVRCKNCGATFVVHSPAAEPAASDLGIDLNDVLGDASGTPSHAASYGNLARFHPATRSPRAARSTEGTVADDVARFLDSFSLPETAKSPREPLRMPDSVLERPAYETKPRSFEANYSAEALEN